MTGASRPLLAQRLAFLHPPCFLFQDREISCSLILPTPLRPLATPMQTTFVLPTCTQPFTLDKIVHVLRLTLARLKVHTPPPRLVPCTWSNFSDAWRRSLAGLQLCPTCNGYGCMPGGPGSRVPRCPGSAAAGLPWAMGAEVIPAALFERCGDQARREHGGQGTLGRGLQCTCFRQQARPL